MATERTLRLGVDSRDAERGYRRAGRAADRFSRSARGSANQIDATTAAFRKLRRIAVGVAAVLGTSRLLRGLINTNREFQRLQAQLQTVEGSLAAANAQFARIERFAVDTPFEVENLTEALVQLRVRGANPTNAEITALGDLASSFTRDITEVADAVSSATAGMTRPLRSLGFEASIVGEEITLSFQGASTTVEREAGAIVTAMAELTSGRLGGAMEREMNTINGAASNLADTLGAVARTIGEQGGLNAAITVSIRTMDQWLQKANEMLPIWLDFIGTGNAPLARERAGISAQLSGMDPDRQMQFLNMRMSVELQNIQRLEEEIANADRTGRGWLTNLQQLHQELATSEQVLAFLRESYGGLAAQIESAADAAGDAVVQFSALERLRMSMARGRLAGAPADDPLALLSPGIRGTGAVTGRMEGPIDFNPFGISADPSEFQGSDVVDELFGSLENGITSLIDPTQIASTALGNAVPKLFEFVQGIIDGGEATARALQQMRIAIDRVELSIKEFAGTATETDRIIAEAAARAQQLDEAFGGVSLKTGLTFEDAIRQGLSFREAFDIDPLQLLQMGIEDPEAWIADFQRQWEILLGATEDKLGNLGDAATEAARGITGMFNVAEFGWKYDPAHFRARDFDVPSGGGGGGGTATGGGTGGDTRGERPDRRNPEASSNTYIIEAHLDGRTLMEFVLDEGQLEAARGGTSPLTITPTRRA